MLFVSQVQLKLLIPLLFFKSRDDSNSKVIGPTFEDQGSIP